MNFGNGKASPLGRMLVMDNVFSVYDKEEENLNSNYCLGLLLTKPFLFLSIWNCATKVQFSKKKKKKKKKKKMSSKIKIIAGYLLYVKEEKALKVG